MRRPNDLTDIRPPDLPGHAVEDHVGHGDLPGHRFTTGFVVNILGQAFDIPDVPASAGIRIWGGSVFTPYPYFCLISPDDFHRGNGVLMSGHRTNAQNKTGAHNGANESYCFHCCTSRRLCAYLLCSLPEHSFF